MWLEHLLECTYVQYPKEIIEWNIGALPGPLVQEEIYTGKAR